eukprot:TRINITY_DN19008_c5_g1_i1.p2 TRINITY_DN19008_c5_g1~~TRINITY_DN19008_c5_g1_i1.p2  ORF type:complete len:135 (-),score=13.74 TRINITY_DN19008_c5_g1_i1:282-686(-)
MWCEMMVNFDVFGVFIEDFILTNVDSALLVAKEGCRRGEVNAQVTKQPLKPNNLNNSVGHSAVFWLSRGLRDNMFLGVPDSKSIIKKYVVPGSGALGGHIAGPVNIRVSTQPWVKGGRKEKTLGDSPLNITKNT